MRQLQETLTSLSESDSRLFRKTLRRFATGVTVITTMDEGSVHGMTANAFCFVSLEPPLVLISVGKHTHMHHLLAKSRHYAVSILSKDQEELARHFAGQSQERLAVPFVWHEGSPLIKGAIAYVTCQIIDVHPAGDHTLYIGQVEHLRCAEEQAPLLYYGGKYLQAKTVLPVPSLSCIRELSFPGGSSAPQRSLSGSPGDSPVTMAQMLQFAARHHIVPQVEHVPMSQVNEAMAHLQAGKAHYRIVLDTDEAWRS